MQRSSESIAALASALAKAQAELVNPEKTLTAVLRPSRPGEGARTFRYAPLSSGLDIVRKTLGEHEIATLQTTAIDQSSGVVNLTTTLAHASGEWIASVWPICPVTEVATPQRMGAALTYARRYALFTLVGIAGEDDLDAPDLDRAPQGSDDHLPAREQRTAVSAVSRGSSNGRFDGRQKSRTGVLREELSASLRDTLVVQIAGLSSREGATTWAAKALPAKNSLTAADAKLVEDTFEERLRGLTGSDVEQTAGVELANVPGDTASPQDSDNMKTPASRPQRINSGVGSGTPMKRRRNKVHLHHVAQQACLICARKPSDPHHLRFMQPRGLGLKVSDEFTVPLCRMHHRQAHHAGDERAWWQTMGIEPIKAARKLWGETRAAKKRGPPEVRAGKPEAPSGSAAATTSAPAAS
jgi:hypothetical protein